MRIFETYREMTVARPFEGPAQFRCSVCGAACDLPDNNETCAGGYGLDKRNRLVCYPCCGDRDKVAMRKTGRITLYLTHPTIVPRTLYPFADGKVSNWPGSLSFPCRVKRGQHNIAGSRYDAWFTFEGANWHGVQYGENTQLVHCRKIK